MSGAMVRSVYGAMSTLGTRSSPRRWQVGAVPFALDMLDWLATLGLRPAVLVADAGHGANADFRRGLENRGLAHVLQVKGGTTAHAVALSS
ncbi:transposase [Streptomyces sp. NPDC059832]|uniref:transposase n=1 Tax=Streptomyces sp. NPDC059832 TaxID=3346966 RepID=UPI0036641F47